MKQQITACRARMHAGQALTEFLVAALVLVPLFMIVPLIGKYQDISFKTQMASRYVAFEATTFNDSNGGAFKPEAQLADEVRRRFFSNVDAPIKTNDVASNTSAHRNPLWTDHKNKPMIGDFDNDVKVTFGDAGATTHGGAFSSASSPFIGPAKAVQDALDVKDRGIYTGQLSVTLASIAWPKISLGSSGPAGSLETFQLNMTRRTSVMIDQWHALSSSEEEYGVLHRINKPAIFPAQVLKPISQTVGGLVPGIDPGVSGPKLGELQFWRDLVPEDRLK